MNIYNLNYKKLRKQMTLFMKTAYGKIVFILAYTIPIVFTLLFLLVTGDLRYYYFDTLMMYSLVSLMYILLAIVLISFILGTMYFYKELKGFISSNTKN